ncbi:hypothetical protein M9Y10_025314 [Tritrichomonas musculus]|uniref:Uncharacterized protein n=1 Tax=Tritrichomonas musculus TaxID=1915356 RepID=A0ABR2HA53_9EUKA
MKTEDIPDMTLYAKKEDILSTEKITQELSITTHFVNGTTKDKDLRTNIANLDGDLCNILKKSSLIVKGSCNNEDISGEYFFDREAGEYYHYKKGENTFSIYYFYYDGLFRYNDNWVVNFESVSYSYKPEVYDKYCIPNMNFVKNNYALKTEIPEIPTDLVNESALTTALEPYAKLENLNEYRKMNDFSTNNKYTKCLPITTKRFIFHDDGYNYDTAHVKFHENTRLIGTYDIIDYTDNIISKNNKFDFIFNDYGIIDEYEPYYKFYLFKHEELHSYFVWEEYSGAIYGRDCNIANSLFLVSITSATIETNDEICLNSSLNEYNIYCDNDYRKKDDLKVDNIKYLEFKKIDYKNG